MDRQLPRVAAQLVSSRLRSHGAVLLEGPKAVGKTTTARTFAASEVRLDQDRASLTAARVDPRLVLEGPQPRLIDEYQLVEGMWSAVRGWIDDASAKGLFLLTGSSTPADDPAEHTGVGRIAPLHMRTMTLFERQLSTGAVSVASLLDGEVPDEYHHHEMTVAGAVEALAAGGWPTNLGLDTEDAIDANAAYLDMIVRSDMHRVEGVRRDPDGVRRLLASYARNTAQDASLRTLARTGEHTLSESTLYDYLRALKRLLLIEDQESWKPNLRSRVRLSSTPKRHLADPSLAVAALGANPRRLLGPEIELTGFLFESQVIHDLRVYAEPNRADVRFYQDNKGLEVDAVVEARDGRWIGVEVKLGHSAVEAGAHNLLSMRAKLAEPVSARCGALVVVVAHSPTYQRDDGVIVTSLASLGP